MFNHLDMLRNERFYNQLIAERNAVIETMILQAKDLQAKIDKLTEEARQNAGHPPDTVLQR
jgi:ribosomal protein L17